jgi:hypothetical protein
VSSNPYLYSLLGVVGHGFGGYVLPLFLTWLVCLVSCVSGLGWVGLGRGGGCVLGRKWKKFWRALKQNSCIHRGLYIALYSFVDHMICLVFASNPLSVTAICNAVLLRCMVAVLIYYCSICSCHAFRLFYLFLPWHASPLSMIKVIPSIFKYLSSFSIIFY